MIRTALLLLSLSLLMSCGRQSETQVITKNDTPLKYATGFTFTPGDSVTWVEITRPFQGASEPIRYLLVQRGHKIPAHSNNVQVIEVPVDRIVCTSTTHIPLLDYLGETDKLVGFPSTDLISSAPMRERIDAGLVQDLGVDKELNIEQLISLSPALVMSYSTLGDLHQQAQIRELGIPVVLNAEFLESHPLGRAEWIKFMALLFNKGELADSIFNQIEREYLSTRDLVDSISSQPTAMSGIVYGDTWFLPGGKNYATTLLKDAGIKYLWEDDSTSGFLELSFESVYNRARESDLWIGVGSYESLQQLKAADTRYANFQAFENQNIYSYYTRKGITGGSEYLELGYLRPDIILKDLVKIAHPDLLPNYLSFFYERLQ